MLRHDFFQNQSIIGPPRGTPGSTVSLPAFWFLVLVLLLAVLAVYAPHLDNGFIFDDHQQIEHNPLVRGDISWTNAFTRDLWAPVDSELGISTRYYRPLFSLAHRLIYQVGGGEAWAFHFFNLFLHLVSILLIIAVLRLLGFSPMKALGASALFALHPLAAEGIFWASCTSELLLQIGLLLSIIGILAGGRANSSLRKYGGLALALVGLLVGLLSKETAVVIAPLLTLEVLRHPRSERIRRLLFVSPLWVVTVIFLVVRAQIVTTEFGPILPNGMVDVGKFGAALAWYFKQFLAPYPLTPLHEFPLAPRPATLMIGWLSLLFLVTIGIYCIRRRSEGVFWLGWLILPLTLPLIPLLFSFQMVTGPLAERYMYLSLVPACAIMAGFTTQLAARKISEKYRRKVSAMMCLLACLAGGMMVFTYGSAFRNDTTYFQRAFAYNPEGPFVLQWLGVLKMKQGRYREALDLFDRAVGNDGGTVSLALNRAYVLTRLGRLEVAVQAYRELLEKHPGQAGVYLRLGDTLNDLGRPHEAAFQYREELKINPGNVAAMCNLGIYLIENQDPQGAINLWEKALEKKTTQFLLFNLGLAYWNTGKREPAKKYLRLFLEMPGEGHKEQKVLARRLLMEGLPGQEGI